MLKTYNCLHYTPALRKYQHLFYSCSVDTGVGNRSLYQVLMEEFLEKVIFNDYTVKELLPYIIGIAVLMYFGPRIIRRFLPKEESDLFVYVVCDECGWKGKVGKYNKVCRSCNSRVLRETEQ